MGASKGENLNRDGEGEWRSERLVGRVILECIHYRGIHYRGIHYRGMSPIGLTEKISMIDR